MNLVKNLLAKLDRYEPALFAILGLFLFGLPTFSIYWTYSLGNSELPTGR
jgi:hypothetical protein